MNGYILVSRGVVESGIWRKPHLYLKVWVWLLCNAQFKKYKNLERGQVFTSVEEIRQACSYYVGYRKEAPTKKQIRDVLQWLRNPCEKTLGRDCETSTAESMIETTKVTHGIVITICNFNKYQDPDLYEGDIGSKCEQAAGGTTKRQRRSQQGRNIHKEEREEREEKEREYIKPALGEFENVLLSEEELEKLKGQFPYDWQQWIERLSRYMASKGKRYKSHYATMLSWDRKEKQEEEGKQKGRSDWIDDL